MTTAQDWRVRIHSERGRVVGAGVLLDPVHVLTAAHVVSRTAPEEPRGARLRVDFLSATESRTATVLADGWSPATGESGADLAVLAIDGPAVTDVDPPLLRPCGPAGGRPVRFFGHPVGFDAGVWAQGRLIGYGGPTSELVQLEPLDPGTRRGAAGFGGAGVVDESTGAVIGYITAAHRRSTGDTVWVVPLEAAARYWSPLSAMLSGPPPRAGARPGPAGDKPAVYALVMALLQVRAMSDEYSRHRIVDLLPGSIAHAIPRSPNARQEMFAIVNTCLAYPDGIRELLDLIRAFEGPSAAMSQVEQIATDLPSRHHTG